MNNNEDKMIQSAHFSDNGQKAVLMPDYEDDALMLHSCDVRMDNNLSRLFSMHPKFQEDLDKEGITEDLKKLFINNKLSLSEKAEVKVQKAGEEWMVSNNDDKDRQYTIKKEGDKLNIYISPDKKKK